jgi:hypothetical protein
MRTASRTRTLPSETGCRRSTDANRTASAPRSVAQRATLPMHRDLAEVARHVAECEPLRIRKMPNLSERRGCLPKILPPYPVTGCQRTEWPMPRQAAGSTRTTADG